MSEIKEGEVSRCEVVVGASSEGETNQKDPTNTLKSVRKKIRNFTIKRSKKSENENSKSETIADPKETNSEESLSKSKLTLKKLFRKPSFKKIFNNIQNFTNFTVSGLRPLRSFTIRAEKGEEEGAEMSCLS